MGGKKEPAVPDIQVASIGDVYSGAVGAQISQLPRLLEAYQKYGPAYAQAQSDLFIKNQQRLGEAFPDQYRVLQPLSRGIASNLDFINQAGQTNLPENLRLAFQNDIRSGQAARGMAESPVSALSEAQYLGQQGETFRSNVTQEGIQFMGLSPLIVPGSQTDLTTLGLAPADLGGLTELSAQQSNLATENAYNQYALQIAAYNRKLKQQQQSAGGLSALATLGGTALFGPAGGAAAGLLTGTLMGAGNNMGAGQGALTGFGGVKLASAG